MIMATLFFENGIDVGDVVASLRGLPEPIRPLCFAEDEGVIIADNVLSDELRFDRLRRNGPAGLTKVVFRNL